MPPFPFRWTQCINHNPLLYGVPPAVVIHPTSTENIGEPSVLLPSPPTISYIIHGNSTALFYAWICLWSGRSNHRIKSVITSRRALLVSVWSMPSEIRTCSNSGNAFKLSNINRQWLPVELCWKQSYRVSLKSYLDWLVHSYPKLFYREEIYTIS